VASSATCAASSAISAGSSGKADTGSLRAEFARTQGEVVLLRWMTGFGLALNLTILAKLFLN